LARYKEKNAGTKHHVMLNHAGLENCRNLHQTRRDVITKINKRIVKRSLSGWIISPKT
jgi:hypothetical protein